MIFQDGRFNAVIFPVYAFIVIDHVAYMYISVALVLVGKNEIDRIVFTPTSIKLVWEVFLSNIHSDMSDDSMFRQTIRHY